MKKREHKKSKADPKLEKTKDQTVHPMSGPELAAQKIGKSGLKGHGQTRRRGDQVLANINGRSTGK